MKKSILSISLLLTMLVPCFGQDRSTNPEKYYLLEGDVVNSLQLLPPPPADSTAHYAYDREMYEWGKSMRDTPRGKQAIQDANLDEGWQDRDFSEAFGFALTPENAPEIVKLLANMKEDAGDLATRDAKNYYMRKRPFMVYNEPSATPGDEESLSKNGSYPSGHTAIGWASALVLSEINPAREQELIQRGYDFGESRVICGAHYQSDVDAGRIVGAAVVARLHADEGFQKQLSKAKAEFARLQQQSQNSTK